MLVAGNDSCSGRRDTGFFVPLKVFSLSFPFSLILFGYSIQALNARR